MSSIPATSCLPGDGLTTRQGDRCHVPQSIQSHILRQSSPSRRKPDDLPRSARLIQHKLWLLSADRKTFAIGILTLTAVILFIGQFLPVRTAIANDSIGDRDYQLVTVRTQQGGDALYVFQRRSGIVAVFQLGIRTIAGSKLRGVRSVQETILPWKTRVQGSGFRVQ